MGKKCEHISFACAMMVEDHGLYLKKAPPYMASRLFQAQDGWVVEATEKSH